MYLVDGGDVGVHEVSRATPDAPQLVEKSGPFSGLCIDLVCTALECPLTILDEMVVPCA